MVVSKWYQEAQERHRQAHRERGFDVERIRAGQTRPHGPTRGEYIVTDLSEKLSREEVLNYCVEYVERADIVPRHSLVNHVRGLDDLGEGKWRYRTGHEWSG